MAAVTNPVIPFNVAAPLAGGELCSGMTIVLTLQMMWEHGLTIGVQHDKKRQILLNLICFICAINTTISYGYNATKASILVSDVTTIITFVSVQYCLVILNHNTVIRAANIVTDGHMSRERLERYCSALYILPLVVLIPIYLAFIDTAGSGLPLNTSKWNLIVFKPINVGLIMVTAVLATITDIILLKKVDSHLDHIQESFDFLGTKGNSDQARTSNERQFRLRTDLWMHYAITWALLIADVALKSVISTGVPLLFDSIVTILTVAMRSRCNLQFGLEMQRAFQGASTFKAATTQREISDSGPKLQVRPAGSQSRPGVMSASNGCTDEE